MKSVMVSIQPQWCELIASGKKTVEVRKRKPKIETPFKVYIYMTNNKNQPLRLLDNATPYWETLHFGKGKAIGEFVCDDLEMLFDTNGNPQNYMAEILPDILKRTALTYKEFQLYANGRASKNSIYGWHISNLVIYAQPKELSEFFVYCGENPKCDGCEAHYYSNTESGKEDYCCSIVDGHRPLKRPPQSWCYVVEKGVADE